MEFSGLRSIMFKPLSTEIKTSVQRLFKQHPGMYCVVYVVCRGCSNCAKKLGMQRREVGAAIDDVKACGPAAVGLDADPPS